MVCLDAEHAGLSPGRCGVPFLDFSFPIELGCGGGKGALAVPARHLAARARLLLVPLLPGNLGQVHRRALLYSQAFNPPGNGMRRLLPLIYRTGKPRPREVK